MDRYRPTSTKQLVGQKGEASNASKLAKWLRNWKVNHAGGAAKSKKTPHPPISSARGKDKGFCKAVLLAGPPGVGKTSTAQLVCKVAI